MSSKGHKGYPDYSPKAVRAAHTRIDPDPTAPYLPKLVPIGAREREAYRKAWHHFLPEDIKGRVVAPAEDCVDPTDKEDTVSGSRVGGGPRKLGDHPADRNYVPKRASLDSWGYVHTNELSDPLLEVTKVWPQPPLWVIDFLGRIAAGMVVVGIWQALV